MWSPLLPDSRPIIESSAMILRRYSRSAVVMSAVVRCAPKASVARNAHSRSLRMPYVIAENGSYSTHRSTLIPSAARGAPPICRGGAHEPDAVHLSDDPDHCGHCRWRECQARGRRIALAARRADVELCHRARGGVCELGCAGRPHGDALRVRELESLGLLRD